MYTGCSALVIGCGVKAGVRFLSYDWYKSLLKDHDVSLERRGGLTFRASCRRRDHCWVGCELMGMLIL